MQNRLARYPMWDRDRDHRTGAATEMTWPLFEVADVIRTAGRRFRERASLTWPQAKVLDAIARCRTAALGGHRDQCSNCGYQAISYNSCRNRHCPKCQTNARDKWLPHGPPDLLPVATITLSLACRMRSCR